MAKELQSLLEKIQSDGVEKANEKASAIIAEAEKKAEAKISEAERRCAELREKADADAEVFRLRSEQAVKQAARDVVLGVSQSIQQTLERVLLENVRDNLQGDFLRDFLASAIRAFADSPDATGGMEIRVSPEQAEGLSDYARSKLAGAVKDGVVIAPDSDVQSGIRVMLADGRIEHDFTDKAIMDAMSRILRPALTEIIFQ
ncbi:MAG: hypothetical protein GX804_10055 [Lentisphaerae bacterium]|jgi:V/A-type H+-transporting ATPase subunit E|nr:hypothetical protein [Lentisphaerota bacterium]